MGNTHSTSSTGKHTCPLHPYSDETPDISDPHPHDVIDSSEVNQTPIENEEGDSSPGINQRRRSLLRFPSLRRRSWSVSGSNDQGQDISSSLSRRRWRAFSGLRSRPVSNVVESTSPAAAPKSPQDDLRQSVNEPKPNDKGKEREKDLSETAQMNGSNDLGEIHKDVNVPGSSTSENKEIVSPSEVMLQELRDLQDTFSTKDELQSDNVDPKLGTDAGSSQSQVDRPSTPIPISGMNASSSVNPASGSRGSNAPDNASHTAVAEALGSWLGGRPQMENSESPLIDSPIASSSRSYGMNPLSMYPNERPRRYNEPVSISSASGSHVTGGLGSPSIPDAAPELYASGSGTGQSSSSPRSPTLPPTGTGTLVVVQGVVHTTDVRQSSSWTAPASQTTGSSSTHLPRSTSSTPTLRTSTLGTSSQSASGASTPQPPSTPLRSRFSSLASGLRQRSRPHTPTSLRTAGLGSWRHGFGEGGSGNFSHNETTSERSLGLGAAVERGVSDSETGSTAFTTESSSTNAAVSTDDTSTMESAANPSSAQDTSDDPISPDCSQVRNGGENAETLANTNSLSEQRATDDRDRDTTSDDEGEAELSASSIEILGTLLSVATAATAASLVTGTTEPLFSSGLAGSPGNGRNPTPTAHNAPTVNSMSPLPRPSHRSTPPASPLGTDNGAEAVANTRMRAAWESLRDRFSRTRGRRAGTIGDTPGEPREDPREQMLREMARVFNMGLGLEEDSNERRPEQHENRTSEILSSESRQSESSSPATSHSLPETNTEPSNHPASEQRDAGPEPGPEGSFERFLHDLQVDLRTALTDDYAARRARAQARGVRTNNPGAASLSNPVATPGPLLGPTAPVPPNSNPRVTSEEGFDQEIPVSIPIPEVLQQSTDLVPTVPNTPRTANLDLPHLPGDDSQSNDGTRTPPQAQGITGQPGAGINWWRLYRFPPMQLAPHPSAASADAPSPSGFSSARPPSASPSQNPPRTSPTETQPPLTDGRFPPGSEGTASQNVVPVIVVGLQSVPVSRVEAHHHDIPAPFGSRFNDPSPSNDTSIDVPGRDRPWPLRAASRAFNRMGRRTDAEFPLDSDMDLPDVDAVENTGIQTRRIGRQSGRTYLIFVIGGYYPPNHSIVTGADDMNSFEALWELADLLGQVKPPVASKEDIEKSGLEILKSSCLPEYEKSGKVASNTVDRCLICLDDYEEDGDLRLLTCRHVFHKLCVDRWLEQGRNNCPACRSKGVQTTDDLPTSPPPHMANMPFEPPP